MKKLILFFGLMMALVGLQAQSSKQVQWNFTSKKIAENTFEIHMTANINGNWHLYAQDAGEGPVSTSFEYIKNPLILVEGKIKEVGKVKKVHEAAFGSDVKFYEKTVDFVQVVKLKSNVKTNLAGKVEFMVCDDKQCLPPTTVDFKVIVGG